VSIESVYATSYNSGDISATVFEILTFKARYSLFSPPTSFDVPARGNPLEFLDETYPTKTTGMGLQCGEIFIILSSTVFD